MGSGVFETVVLRGGAGAILRLLPDQWHHRYRAHACNQRDRLHFNQGPNQRHLRGRGGPTASPGVSGAIHPPSCHFNGRLLSLENGRVRLRWRDSRDHNQIKEMTLEAVEFIRRFLLHGAGYSASPGKFEVLDALAG
jgi:hypothetical protein